MTTRYAGRWLATLSLGALLGLAPVAAHATGEGAVPAKNEARERPQPRAPQPKATDNTSPPSSAPGTPEEANRQELRYAAREAQSPRLAAFEGGGAGIYISGSALAVVLIVVLLVVLL